MERAEGGAAVSGRARECWAWASGGRTATSGAWDQEPECLEHTEAGPGCAALHCAPGDRDVGTGEVGNTS